jgi:hypothetical protein
LSACALRLGPREWQANPAHHFATTTNIGQSSVRPTPDSTASASTTSDGLSLPSRSTYGVMRHMKATLLFHSKEAYRDGFVDLG